MKKYSRFLRGFAITLISVLVLFQSARAEVNALMEISSESISGQAVDGQSLMLTFADLGAQTAIDLQGPYQASSLFFSLPSDWIASSPVQIKLQGYSIFQSLMQVFIPEAENANLVNLTGVIQIFLNGELAGEIEIAQSGDFTDTFFVEPNLIKDNSGLNELTFAWDAAAACQYGTTTIVSIDANSHITIPFTNKNIKPLLNDFPKPFYSQNNIQPYPVALIIPEDAEENDLSAMLAVSASLGKQSSGRMEYELFSLDEVVRENLENHHLIFIGRAASFENFFANEMPEISLTTVETEDSGVIQITNSSWNAGRAVLLVTGGSEQALLKASASLAADDFLPFSDGDMAVITAVSDAFSSSQYKIDQEFGYSLDEKVLLVEKIGENTLTIPFSIPGDSQVSAEAYIEIYFRHSQLIDYLQSSLTVSLNGSKIGSVRFSDQSAENGLARIILPPGSLQPLKNELEITYTIVPQDLCADERSGNFWVAILEDSYLHLPLVLESPAVQARIFLDDLPAVLLSDYSLSQLMFVAENGDIQSWKYASTLAFDLGQFTDSDVLQLSAKFAGPEFEEEQGMKYVLIGKTDVLSFSAQLNDKLPLPFNADGSIDLMPLSGIQFSLDQSQPLGILEITELHDSSSMLFCILGNSSAGLEVAFEIVKTNLNNPITEAANAAIVDSGSNSHYLLIEPKMTASDNEVQAESKWYERFLGLNMEKANAYLLFGSILITIIFIVYLFFGKSEKKSS